MKTAIQQKDAVKRRDRCEDQPITPSYTLTNKDNAYIKKNGFIIEKKRKRREKEREGGWIAGGRQVGMRSRHREATLGNESGVRSVS